MREYFFFVWTFPKFTGRKETLVVTVMNFKIKYNKNCLHTLPSLSGISLNTRFLKTVRGRDWRLLGTNLFENVRRRAIIVSSGNNYLKS